MQIDWVASVPVAAAIVAFGSMLFSFRSSQIARNSLKLSLRSAQAAYESSKADPRPAVAMAIDVVEYRQADTLPVDKKSLEGLNILELFAAHNKIEELTGVSGDTILEVSVRGNLKNNTAHDILLTFKPYGDHWLSQQQDCSIEFNRTRGQLLEPGSEDTFECVIRRTADSWASINQRLTLGRFLQRSNLGDAPHVVRWLGYMLLGAEYFVRQLYFIERCEVMFVCEPRFSERVATVWRMQIRQNPVLKHTTGSEGMEYSVLSGRLRGPFDDSIIFYRGEFDSTLAQIRPSKFVSRPPGRER